MKSSIPRVATANMADRKLLEAIKEAIEIGDGITGNPLDRKLTVRDIVDSGIATLSVNNTASYVKSTSIKPNYPDPVVVDESGNVIDLTTPNAPENLVAFKGVGSVFLTWDKPDFDNYAHTNIYRATTDNFSNAVVVSNVLGTTYADYVPIEILDEETGDIRGYYYWTTFTTTAGIEGAPNATSGTYQEPTKNGDDAIFQLSVNLLVGDTANFVTANINDASISSAKIAQIIQSDNYDADNGWMINKNGVAVFNNVSIRGSAQSQGYGPATAGWQLNSNGTFTLRSSGGDVVMTNEGVPIDAVVGAGSLAELDEIDDGVYIGNAIIDTLHLAGQAVTIPSGAYTSGEKNVGSSNTIAQSVTYTSTGAPTAVFFSVVVHSKDTHILNTISYVTIQILRGSTVVYDYQVPVYGEASSGGESSTNYSYKKHPFSGCIVDNSSAGSRTYSIKVINGGANTKKVSRRSIIALELKK